MMNGALVIAVSRADLDGRLTWPDHPRRQFPQKHPTNPTRSDPPVLRGLQSRSPWRPSVCTHGRPSRAAAMPPDPAQLRVAHRVAKTPGCPGLRNDGSTTDHHRPRPRACSAHDGTAPDARRGEGVQRGGGGGGGGAGGGWWVGVSWGGRPVWGGGAGSRGCSPLQCPLPSAVLTQRHLRKLLRGVEAPTPWSTIETLNPSLSLSLSLSLCRAHTSKRLLSSSVTGTPLTVMYQARRAT